MRHKKGRYAKWIFSFMVPLTAAAFAFGWLTIGDEVVNTFNAYYGVSKSPVTNLI